MLIIRLTVMLTMMKISMMNRESLSQYTFPKVIRMIFLFRKRYLWVLIMMIGIVSLIIIRLKMLVMFVVGLFMLIVSLKMLVMFVVGVFMLMIRLMRVFMFIMRFLLFMM